MPAYDYRCRICDTSFEVRRSMAETATATLCPHGHEDTTRVFTAVALGGMTGSGAGTAPLPASASAGGGCCGGGCCG